MITIRNLWLIGLSAIAIATTWAQDNAAAQKDKAQLQGEWAMVSGERDGQAFTADFMKGFKRSAKGAETTVTVQGQIFLKATFTLDPGKSPKTIDYSVTGGTHAGKTQLGIYQLDGDTVKFCFTPPDAARPTSFSTQPNDGRTLSTWKRAKSSP